MAEVFEYVGVLLSTAPLQSLVVIQVFGSSYSILLVRSLPNHGMFGLQCALPSSGVVCVW
jgi:hypothetical protein